ncbi:MAG TPA: tripartite tricarboxylate transporter substrate-binding protein [Pseudolabrys sp.]|nr:tripartite tricarboxylate transporter substrate-binding protein [Pseudolabrys sp.]
MRTALRKLALAATLIAALSALCAADPIEDFYKGRELTILIGHPPGGSYDLYAQLAAAHLGKFIPGHPNVIVQQMPGGAGSKAAAHFYNRATHDGSIIALFPETIAYVQLMDPVQGKWDVTKMRYIGSLAPVNTVFMVRKGGPVKSAQDIFANRTNVGCSGRTSQSYEYPATLKAFANAKFNIVCGYDGSSAYTLALLRGEVDMVSKAWNAWRAENKEQIDDGTLIPILQGGLRRTSELPNVPLMQEATDDQTAKQALTFISSGSAIGRALLAPPGIPDDRLNALRSAFDAMVKDRDFIADAQKRNLFLEPSPGTAVQEASDAIAKTPKDLVQRVAKVFKE